MNNNWNRFIYKIWSPIYDYFFNSGLFLEARKRVFQDIEFKAGESVLFVGVGTGADIDQVPYNSLKVTAIDFSEDMLNQARKKYEGEKIEFIQMDAQSMNLPDNTFDYVIGSLILTVVPDGKKALDEMTRVTKYGGQIVVFDKFVDGKKELSLSKRLIRPLIRLLGTDIGLSFESIANETKSIRLLERKKSLFNGMYQKIVLMKV
ncbi:class I SAM-dependent methyltransferase [Mesobacillus jeotgali]|uniref:class I SAM-dependent methyltransferase n=1 Tax=Mesobacillus jeotgali TaxID=129985 RepID=UPI00177D0D76|nr:methyltransferase domain-containing protein [Mesobacillus jeotgali]UYZ21584.1 methyltransferase domain-containing protein [Mesobacillus jeotgali]